MRIVIAPDKFKGCLSASQVAEAIAAGCREVDAGVDIHLHPMSDGGEGFVDALVRATNGTLVTATVTGPLPEQRVRATYGLLGRVSLFRPAAIRRSACNDCMDCFVVCPEPQVIRPALKGVEGAGPVILAGNCTNCGRCIDVCAKDVFAFGTRFGNKVEKVSPPASTMSPAA